MYIYVYIYIYIYIRPVGRWVDGLIGRSLVPGTVAGWAAGHWIRAVPWRHPKRVRVPGQNLNLELQLSLNLELGFHP